MRCWWPLVLVLVGSASGCVTCGRGLVTSARASNDSSGESLEAYFHQRDATATLCDLEARGPHLQAYTVSVRDTLVDGLLAGAIPPAFFQRCVELLLERLPAATGNVLLQSLAGPYRVLISDGHLETDPARVEQLQALQSLYLARPTGLDGVPAQTAPMLADLRVALEKKKLGTLAARFGRELLDTAEVEQGRWQGLRVDVPMLDALAASGNEMTLSRFAARLPSLPLRDEARRRLIRIHVALSPFPEVSENAAAVEQGVMREGHNPVSLAGHPLVRAWFDTRVPQRTVLVEQHVWRQTATLLAQTPGLPDTALLPELALRGALFAELTGLPRPVSICAPKKELSVEPCIPATAVSVESPFAILEHGAAFRFRDEVQMADVLPLASRETFSLPVKIGDKVATTLQWRLVFERPEPLVLVGADDGGAGPGLAVDVASRSSRRWVVSVRAPRETLSVVVEGEDVGAFNVASRGGSGAHGRDGRSGSAGADGDACRDGSPGGQGGAGGDGGSGGRGGNVDVQLRCSSQTCQEELWQVRRMVASEGGSGGEAGSGGEGGAGGLGGSARAATTHVDSSGSTVTNDAGCSAGSNGRSGSNGRDGNPGPDGSPGSVRVSLIPD